MRHCEPYAAQAKSIIAHVAGSGTAGISLGASWPLTQIERIGSKRRPARDVGSGRGRRYVGGNAGHTLSKVRGMSSAPRNRSAHPGPGMPMNTVADEHSTR
jgi:hypothetical protein